MSTTVNDLIGWFEEFAPQTLQEEYDNCGLQEIGRASCRERV